MASIYDDIDIEFNRNGDLELGRDKDIKTTKNDGLQSLLDQIHSICASTFEDWELYQNRGAALSDFIGEPNNQFTANRIQDRIKISLTASGLILSEDLKVRVFPVHAHKLLAIISIDAIATVFNDLQPGDSVRTALVFDTIEQQVFFLNKTPNILG